MIALKIELLYRELQMNIDRKQSVTAAAETVSNSPIGKEHKSPLLFCQLDTHGRLFLICLQFLHNEFG